MLFSARLLSTSKRGSPALLSFLLTSYCLALIDTLYFSPNFSFRSLVLHPSKLVLTPYNLLKYNSSSSNLAEHGLHPRWLHALVNLPMLFGVGLFVVGDGVRREWRDGGKETKDRKERWMYRCETSLRLNFLEEEVDSNEVPQYYSLHSLSLFSHSRFNRIKNLDSSFLSSSHSYCSLRIARFWHLLVAQRNEGSFG